MDSAVRISEVPAKTAFSLDQEQVPNIRTELPGPRARILLARDHEYMSPSYTRAYPLVCEKGSGAVIQDVDGNLFLDFTAGIAVTATGHCHPEVVRAIKDQAGNLLHMSGTDFYYEPQIELAQRLAQIAPGEEAKKVFFTNSGAESLDGALKLARFHTKRTRAIAFLGAFHGRTYGAMSLSGSKLVHRRGFSPLVPDIHHVPFPRGCRNCEPAPGRCICVEEIENTIFRRIVPPDEVAAIFVEPVQGEGGYYVSPPGFLQALRHLCDRHGILLVADEVQSGMGRTGKMFAVNHWGVVPDILCLAKGIASGLPLGAIIARGDIMDWPPGSHASTFGGNPVSCRAALATVTLLEQEYNQNAEERGLQLRKGLQELRMKYAFLGDVRGLGLMTAVDIINPNRGNQFDPGKREELVQSAFHKGLLLLGCGESALRFCPPLCITDHQVDIALGILEQVLRSTP